MLLKNIRRNMMIKYKIYILSIIITGIFFILNNPFAYSVSLFEDSVPTLRIPTMKPYIRLNKTMTKNFAALTSFVTESINKKYEKYFLISPISPLYLATKGVVCPGRETEPLKFAFRARAVIQGIMELSNYNKNAKFFWNDLTNKIGQMEKGPVKDTLEMFYGDLRLVTEEIVKEIMYREGKYTYKEITENTWRQIGILKSLDKAKNELEKHLPEDEVSMWYEEMGMLINSVFDWGGHGWLVIDEIPYMPIRVLSMYKDLRFVQHPLDILTLAERQEIEFYKKRLADWRNFLDISLPSPDSLIGDEERVPVFEKCFTFLKLSKKDRLIDLGTADGGFLKHTREKGFNDNEKMKGYDSSKSMISSAELRKLPVELADVLELNFGSLKKFNKVAAIDLLQDIPVTKIKDFLTRLIGALQSPGRIFISIFVDYDRGYTESVDAITEKVLKDMKNKYNLSIKRKEESPRIWFEIIKNPQPLDIKAIDRSQSGV